MKLASSLSSVALALTALSLGAGCNPNPSAQEVVDRSAPALCKKAQECGAASFATAYPGGVDDCTAKTKATVSKQYGSDLSRSSVCTDDEVDSCMKALEAEACPADGSLLPAVPCNC